MTAFNFVRFSGTCGLVGGWSSFPAHHTVSQISGFDTTDSALNNRRACRTPLLTRSERQNNMKHCAARMSGNAHRRPPWAAIN